MSEQRKTEPTAAATPSRARELLTFAILAFGIWPFLAVCFVGGYGFLVWFYQILAGPPGPMGH
ncbi:MAG: periplasmic nitrate reductase, NapE protein [Paracoccus sp. (in: a-proteobacteria)]|jgi:nitrate reductase NapE